MGPIDAWHQLPHAAEVEVELQRVGALVIHYSRTHLRPALVHQDRHHFIATIASECTGYFTRFQIG